MALCITVSSGLREGFRDGEPYVLINYAWYLYMQNTFLEINAATGRMVDLYDSVSFSGDELPFVRKAFQNLFERAKAGPESLLFEAGHTLDPEGRKTNIFLRVSRHEIEGTLRQLIDLAILAEVKDEALVCRGD